MMHTPNYQSLEVRDGVSIDYLEAGGEKPVMIMVHGLASNAKAYLKLIPELEDQFHIYAIDLPKFTDREDKSLVGMESFADLIHDFMDKKGIQTVTLCGHSMGGQVAMHFSKKYPDSVDQLVLLAPAGLEKFSEKDYTWFKTYITPQTYLALPDPMIKRNFDVNFYGGQLPEDASFMFEDRMKIKEDSTTYTRYIDYVVHSIFAMLDEPISDFQEDITTPTLIMYGDQDQLIPNKILHPDMSEQTLQEEADKIPNASFSTIDNAGHFLQWDNPQQVAERIIHFIID